MSYSLGRSLISVLSTRPNATVTTLWQSLWISTTLSMQLRATETTHEAMQQLSYDGTYSCPPTSVFESFISRVMGYFFLSVWYLCGYNDTFLIPLHTRSSYIKPISFLWGVTTVRNSASDFEGSLISNHVWKHFRRMVIANWKKLLFFLFYLHWKDKA